MDGVGQDRDVQLVVNNELRLHQPHVRRSAGDVDMLLHPDFFEFGASGRRWERHETVAKLATEAPEEATRMVASDLVGTRLADEVVLVTYVTVRGQQRVHRSSVWRKTDAGWRMYFHQGTPVPTA